MRVRVRALWKEGDQFGALLEDGTPVALGAMEGNRQESLREGWTGDVRIGRKNVNVGPEEAELRERGLAGMTVPPELLAPEPAALLPFQRVAALANVNGYVDIHDGPPKPKGKKHRLTQKAEALDQVRLRALLALLEGRAVLVTAAGRSYAAEKRGEGEWFVVPLSSGEPGHTATATTCSCMDHKARGRECKHMVAVKGAL